MALRRPPTTFSDDITAGDLAANSVTASELADNAVDANAIAANAVVTAKIADSTGASDGITTAKLATDAVTSAKIATGAVIADGIGAGAVVEAGLGAGAVTATKLGDVIGVKPHIQPGILQPAVAGKLLDGTTSHSGAYGTAQADGFSYYYTDIKGSKPIKDPRIGAHFGSQRHKFKSFQKLESESGIHGAKYGVYSIDGREWCRMACAQAPPIYANGDHGHRINNNGHSNDGEFYEVVGYFNEMCINVFTTNSTSYRVKFALNGGSYGSFIAESPYTPGLGTPLTSRYVDVGANIKMDIGATLGINTVKICTGAEMFGVELIAQDTQDFTATNATNILTSAGHTLSNGDQIRLIGGDLPNGLNATTTYYVIGVSGNNFQVSTSSGGAAVTFSDDGSGSRTFRALNNVQIPAQNVVTYGKKYSVSATATHYDPFNGMSGAKTLAQLGDYIDTATSLGMNNWKGGTSNYYRPWNGGRVVKWIASDGTIKTSVTMIPPNAQNHKGAAYDAVSDSEVQSGTNGEPINFDTTTIANASPLSEVAKTFHIREFGNGAANEGSTAGGTKQDISMLDDKDMLSYVMDDGLTAVSGENIAFSANHGLWIDNDDDQCLITFIGTGVSWNTGANGILTAAENLPYGTHIIRMYAGNHQSSAELLVDGKIVKDNYDTSGNNYVYNWAWKDDISFHQPKMPPIPDDACIISDYMLMADFVRNTVGGAGGQRSKGVRFQSVSQDVFYKDGTWSYNSSGYQVGNIYPLLYASGDSDASITAFATNITQSAFNLEARFRPFEINNSTVTTTKNGQGDMSILYPTNSSDVPTLGVNKYGHDGTGTSSIDLRHYEIATPTHTSSHYQSFETNHRHVLIGGDRNMEQNNLVVTADGKTWDEVTRNTSYLGPSTYTKATMDNGHPNGNILWDYHIGDTTGGRGWVAVQKNIATAYDRFIILEDGYYSIYIATYNNAASAGGMWIMINSTSNSGMNYLRVNASGQDESHNLWDVCRRLKRGDFIMSYAPSGPTFHGTEIGYTRIEIMKIGD
jgi:hypothetical protein